MYLDGLDELDQRILELLTKNARYSYSDIGEIVGISRVAVKSRITAMEEAGIIEGYTTVINPQKISGAVSCFFDIETEPSGLGKVEEILAGEDMITQIYRITGKSRLHVHAVAESQEKLEIFIRETVDQLPHIRQISSDVILTRIKDVKGLRL